ncbi:hypothetical protein ABTN24_19330, partial [Acinetobacter baumannii]
MAVYAQTEKKFYLRENGVWVTFASTTNGKVVLSLNIGNFGTSSSATGATFSDTTGRLVLTITPADINNPGAVSTTTQTFKGNKTFNDNVIAN